ncbi:lipopolysaccharide kinase InaA family protein [Embleya sp. NBC_00896]|uniref:lipopolysaccharide kinase InaA family protein n=1 Tax=Embleya sp. NBC_00896 TaxID=2975961 RepID=UPI00386A995A|nr:molecular chaperone DnaJ [Embleya sp. NBC_00896]
MTRTPGTTSTAPVTLEDALDLLTNALDPQAVFGPYDGTPEACLRAGSRTYRLLARLLHPDTAPEARRTEAAAAFTRLGELWNRYQQDITGVTGRQVVITTKRRVYSVGEERARGDIATLYKVAYRAEDDGESRALLKLPRSVTDNDLMEREATALERIAREGDPEYAAYVPRLIETFRYRDAKSGTERRANVIERVRGFRSLTEVREAYPDGLDARDVAWMWRRLLVAIGYAHRAGVVHGAITPDHVLIHPREHGLVLVDWCYSVLLAGPDDADRPDAVLRAKAVEHVPAMIDRHAALYPPEIPGKQPPETAADVYMATKCVTDLLAADAPKALLRFARGCSLPAPARRPHDAWKLLGELDELLGKLYGPRRFRPFAMPSRREPKAAADPRTADKAADRATRSARSARSDTADG